MNDKRDGVRHVKIEIVGSDPKTRAFLVPNQKFLFLTTKILENEPSVSHWSNRNSVYKHPRAAKGAIDWILAHGSKKISEDPRVVLSFTGGPVYDVSAYYEIVGDTLKLRPTQLIIDGLIQTDPGSQIDLSKVH